MLFRDIHSTAPNIGDVHMESIVKMGVSGKNPYGKKAPEDNQYPPGRRDDAGAGKETAPASAEKAVPAVSTDQKTREKQELEKKKAEEKRRAEQRRIAEEERALHRKRRAHYSMIARYVVYTVVISYFLLNLTDNFGDIMKIVGHWIGMIGVVVTPLFWGFVLAYILSPAVEMLEDHLSGSAAGGRRRKSRRGLAVAITWVAVLLVLTMLFSLIVSAFSRSLQVASLDDVVAIVQSFAGSLQSFRKTIMQRISEMSVSSEELASALRQIGAKAAEFTNGLSNKLTGALGQVGGFMTNLLFSIIFSVYFLLDSKSLARYWNRVLVAIGGKTLRKDLRILASDADEVFSGYIRGQLIDAFIMAVLVSSSLSLIGVKYAVIIGVLSGIGNLIPYVGPVVAYGSTILVCLITGDYRRLLVAIVVLFVIQTIDGNVINPRLLSSNVDVHPVLVIAALIVGGAVGGIVGMLFAVPIAAFFKIQFEKVIDRLLIARMPEKEQKARHRERGSGEEPVRSSALTEATEKKPVQEGPDQTGRGGNSPLNAAKKEDVQTGTKTAASDGSAAVKKQKARRSASPVAGSAADGKAGTVKKAKAAGSTKSAKSAAAAKTTGDPKAAAVSKSAGGSKTAAAGKTAGEPKAAAAAKSAGESKAAAAVKSAGEPKAATASKSAGNPKAAVTAKSTDAGRS